MLKKEILVAIDFSECSINALEHAITIAQRANSDLQMVWVGKPDSAKSDLEAQGETGTAEVISRFDELVKKYKKKLEGQNFSYKLRYGKVYKEIIAEAHERNSLMIVCGTHGTAGFEEFWIGSNAFRIVTSAPCPTITIREGIQIRRTLSNIILPLDSTVETRQKVPFTAYMAKLFNAKIHIVGLFTTQVFAVRDKVERYMDQVAKYLEENGIHYQKVVLDADNITDATIEYAKSVNANLISIMTEQERTTANLWLGPYAQQMVNHSPFPVLSIQPKEFIRSTY
ncbi:MAG TPA: universal stress protein [Bacteroidales bacterium]|nr:universal stress protein [Lentimicrobiaceae bacterium]HOH99249.1 universal stress protein [Bacteroidales bacterium]